MQYCLQLTRAKQESDSESGRESDSELTEREKDGYLAFNQLGHWTLVEGRNNFYCKGKFNMLSVFVVAIVEKIPVYRWVLMGLGGGGGVGGINPISQPIFDLNTSPTESSSEEKGVKYAIFGGGTSLKGQ